MKDQKDGGENHDTVYRLDADGIRRPPFEIVHREEEFDQDGFEILARMQEEHFWYRGRHRFLLDAMNRELSRIKRSSPAPLDAVDLGGGCGGWISYLLARTSGRFSEIALADSSPRALQLARGLVGEGAHFYQADLMNLSFNERWDAAFLLDVIEHLPDDLGALRQARDALRPGGLLFVTAPALRVFWSYNDELAEHLRRYSKKDFARLAAESGLKLVRAQYFMFLLSPLILLRRLFRPNIASMTKEEIRGHLRKTHRTPPAAINRLLDALLQFEATLGNRVPLPWGTSLLGVFRKE